MFRTSMIRNQAWPRLALAAASVTNKMKRLAYIDWMRGLACVLMFQTHCYDSWMSSEAKKSSSLIAWSRLGGALPGPLFIFLAGLCFSVGRQKLCDKGGGLGALASQKVLDGAE